MTTNILVDVSNIEEHLNLPTNSILKGYYSIEEIIGCIISTYIYTFESSYPDQDIYIKYFFEDEDFGLIDNDDGESEKDTPEEIWDEIYQKLDSCERDLLWAYNNVQPYINAIFNPIISNMDMANLWICPSEIKVSPLRNNITVILEYN